jgi:hypothetical protein
MRGSNVLEYNLTLNCSVDRSGTSRVDSETSTQLRALTRGSRSGQGRRNVKTSRSSVDCYVDPQESMITRAVLGEMTQGVVFSGASADQYIKSPVWGICITARCDAAHDKAPVFNYLPIVRFEDWLLVDGRRLLCEQLHSDSLNSAANRLRQKKFSPSVLESYPPEDVAQKLFPLDADRPEREAAQFHELAARISKIRELARAETCQISEITSLTNGADKILERLLKELIKAGLVGYYYLESIGETEHVGKMGYVILMREIHHVASATMRRMAGGIDKYSWKAETGSNTPEVPNFDFFEFVLPTARVMSPNIEHLLQAFGMLYMRIGLPDTDASLLVKLRGAFDHE